MFKVIVGNPMSITDETSAGPNGTLVRASEFSLATGLEENVEERHTEQIIVVKLGLYFRSDSCFSRDSKQRTQAAALIEPSVALLLPSLIRYSLFLHHQFPSIITIINATVTMALMEGNQQLGQQTEDPNSSLNRAVRGFSCSFPYPLLSLSSPSISLNHYQHQCNGYYGFNGGQPRMASDSQILSRSIFGRDRRRGTIGEDREGQNALVDSDET
ncbi:hypothetical protein Cgig2_028300 [Carnegiea gigantea]|uniref:Uncharacterized protein n=1 Tax=Carnegiea gigantea TaxID=171969 RepID=A0A9Q1GW57_9CARY|nr:hypothetical protein Cgig2_028300 [Carnegiea gigantea]